MLRAWERFFYQILKDEKEAQRVAAMVRRGCGNVAKATNKELDSIVAKHDLDPETVGVIRRLQIALVDH